MQARATSAGLLQPEPKQQLQVSHHHQILFCFVLLSLTIITTVLSNVMCNLRSLLLLLPVLVMLILLLLSLLWLLPLLLLLLLLHNY